MGIIYPIMDFAQKNVVYHACRILLRPVTSMLLRVGMTWKEFADLSKSLFVQAATEEFGIRGRPTNVSRVSILTGISRKEVKRQRDLLAANEPAVKGKTTDATRLLSGWFQDSDYLDEKSAPKLLKQTGPKPSFESLCASYGGDIAMPTMLKELIKTKAVQKTSSGRLKVLSRYYQPVVRDDEMLHYGVKRISDLTETINNNIFPAKKHIPRFEGYADNDRISASAIPAFRKFLDQRGQEFLEEIDDWLAQHATDDADETTDFVRIGIGLYSIEDKKLMENSQ